MDSSNILIAANKCSLEIDYKQFAKIHPFIVVWLAEALQSVIEVMGKVSTDVVFDLHPKYKNIHQKIYLRITNLTVDDQIRNIRQIHLNTMIHIGVVVTRLSEVKVVLTQNANQRDHSMLSRRYTGTTRSSLFKRSWESCLLVDFQDAKK